MHPLRLLLCPVCLLGPSYGQQPPEQAPERTAERRIAGLIERLGAPDLGAVAVAQEELRRLGRSVVRPLMRTVRSGGRIAGTRGARHALEVVGSLGPAGVGAFDELVEALPSCGSQTFLPVLRAIGDLVPYSPFQGDPRLLERLVFANRTMIRKFEQSNDRQRFQFEFNRLQQRSQVDPEAGRAAMIAELERNRSHRREVAAEVLGRLGSAAQDAIPALVRGLRNGGPVVGQIGGFRVPRYRDRFPRAASDALIRIAPRDPRTSIAWGWQLENSPSAELRVRAVLRIGGFGSAAVGQVEALRAALRDASERVRSAAVTALGMIGPGARAAAPALERIAAGSDPAAAARAAAALGRIRAAPPPAAGSSAGRRR